MKCRSVYSSLVLFVLIVTTVGCKKYLVVDPPGNALTRDRVFQSETTAKGAVNAIYTIMLDAGNFSSGDLNSITMLGSLSADELIPYSRINATPLEFSDNDLHADNSGVQQLWTSAYRIIYLSNAVIEGLANSPITPAIKEQLQGEALVIRAFCHFYLVNLFGNVPIVTSTNYEINSSISRFLTDSVYAAIISDLQQAQTLLGENYVDIERIRPNQLTASALLARVFLYQGKWEEAKNEATTVIDYPAYRLVSLDSVFLKNSAESIWQLKPYTPLGSGSITDAYLFSFPNAYNYNVLTSSVVNAFEPADNRSSHWLKENSTGGGVFVPFKYKQTNLLADVAEYAMVLRLGEQYLIRAEARTRLGEIDEAKDDLLHLRRRAGLPDDSMNADDQTSLLTAIEHERQVELFTEWGHRWLDLKRTGRADQILGTIKSKWTPEDVLYPVPQIELNKNKNLSPQNEGYQ